MRITWRVATFPRSAATGLKGLVSARTVFNRLGRRAGLRRTGRGTARAFLLDTKDNRVGSASYRAMRRMAFDIRKTARQSMRKARRPKSISRHRPAVQAAYNRRRHYWHASGQRFREPQIPTLPSKPGSPPRVVVGHLKNKRYGVWAAPGPGVRPTSTKQFFAVGPRVFPRARTNARIAPRLHEQGGVGKQSATFGSGTARFPKRPFMSPAHKKRIHLLKQFTAEAIREALSK